ncbi:hypothetical protein MKEN_00921100 [Mycena kentingensis (nom. inval.)]|nr:hypothetical protein MKEN_00921100 [Mycena kentingensis (nom. inval.)]
MVLQIQIRFDGCNPFVARRWRIPGNIGPFNAFPKEIKLLTISNKHLFMNRIADDVRGVFPLSQIHAWALERDEERLVYAKAESEDDTSFCLRFIFNAQVVARNPRSQNYQHFQRLVKDAENYVKFARVASGIFLPAHFGLWVMETGAFAGTVLVSITPWCGETWTSLVRTRFDTEANRVLIGRTLEMLHDAGLEFKGDMGNDGDFRHVLIDFDDPLLPKSFYRT